VADTPWRITPDGVEQWQGADGNWYASQVRAVLAGTPADPYAPPIYRRPTRTKTYVARILTIVWAIAVVIAFAAGGVDWGVFVLVVGPALALGIGLVVVNDANRISKVGMRGASGLHCPKCGGNQFTAKRSAGGKVGLGLLAPKTRVEWVTCGAQYTRG
jgi:hypothetical protein